MKYIVFDLEATCWKIQHPDRVGETIEIGALKLNTKGEVEGEFNSFIYPARHTHLSEFCTQLTSISQAEVDAAPDFTTVMNNFQKWIGNRYCLCSWGFFDRKQLTSDCDWHGLDSSWLGQHISLKHQYADFQQLDRPKGVSGALEKEGLSFKGTQHRGIDDARNITRIFQLHLDKWQFPHI